MSGVGRMMEKRGSCRPKKESVQTRESRWQWSARRRHGHPRDKLDVEKDDDDTALPSPRWKVGDPNWATAPRTRCPSSDTSTHSNHLKTDSFTLLVFCATERMDDPEIIMSRFLFSTIDVSRQVFYHSNQTFAIVNLKPILPGRTVSSEPVPVLSCVLTF